MIKLCIFDLDGTTADTLASIAHFANAVLSAHGFDTFPVDDYRTLAGGGAAKLWRNITGRLGIADEDLRDRMKEEWISIYSDDYLYLTSAFDGIPRMLSCMRRMGIATAVVTNKDKRIADRICSKLFPGLLDEVISDHPGMALKPDPGEILALARRRGVSLAETLYAGDHVIDMKAGKNAGVITAGVTWGFCSRDELISAGADIIAEMPEELTEYCKKTMKDKGSLQWAEKESIFS